MRESALADRTWELWNLRALRPAADAGDLCDLRQRRETILAKEREAFAGLWSGDRGHLIPGHRFFTEHPELRTGIIVSLHLGPYKLVPEIFLAARVSPVVLVNARALKRMKPDFELMTRRLGLHTPITWIEVGRDGFVRQLLAEVRRGRPVIVYLDGNAGQGGYQRTRDRGLDYHLPGREIRIRTGLARLICRLALPVHTVAVRWDEQGRPCWENAASQRWSRADDPDHVARLLYDWLFDQVQRWPEQWHFWLMLKESSACFSRSRLLEPGVPRGLHGDFREAFFSCLNNSASTVRMILERSVEVWPGEVLADLTGDRFFPAAGLRDRDLDPLRNDRPTLAHLSEIHGRAWVEFHGLRMCLLGLARLGG